MKLLNSFWFVDVGRLLYNGPTISHFFINSRIKRWIDWKKWKRLMGGPLSLRMEWLLWNESKERKQLNSFNWLISAAQWNKRNEMAHQRRFTPAASPTKQFQFSSPAARDEELELIWLVFPLFALGCLPRHGQRPSNNQFFELVAGLLVMGAAAPYSQAKQTSLINPKKTSKLNLL